MFFKNKSRSVIFFTREGDCQAGYDIRSKMVSDLLIKKGYECKIISFQNMIQKRESDLSFIKKIILNIKAFLLLFKISPKVIILQRVNFHVIGFLAYRLIFKVKVILDIDDWEYKEDIKKLFFISNSISETLTRFICFFSNYVIVSSSYLENYFKPYSQNIIKIPSTVLNAKVKLPDWNSSIFYCIWAGSIDVERKEVYEELINLISVFKEFANSRLRLKLIVKGNLVSELLDYIKIMGSDKISLDVNLTFNEVILAFSESHFGLLPLFSNNRFFNAKSPVKLFEYLRNGLIPVISNNGEALNILKNIKTGFFADNVNNMISILNSLCLKNSIELENISRKIKSLFDNELDLQKQIILWEKVIDYVYCSND